MRNLRWDIILKVFVFTLIILVFVFSLYLAIILGYRQGFMTAQMQYEAEISNILKQSSYFVITPKGTSTPQPSVQVSKPIISWGGPELWDIINKKRVEYGVNPLKQKDELCTIASIRLNELLALGKLDGHEGFSNLAERRTDLKWIFNKYVIAEFLVQGAQSAQDAVLLWENTLGHKKLLTGGEYVWGCVYAQDGFAVAISAYE